MGTPLCFATEKTFWLAVLVTVVLLPASTLHAETWVITTKASPISGIADRQILLDEALRLESELAAKLPADQERASAIVQQRLKQGGTDLQRRIGTAYQGIADAWSLGVTKVPAIVVDRRYVVYGETDVARAVARIDQY